MSKRAPLTFNTDQALPTETSRVLANMKTVKRDNETTSKHENAKRNIRVNNSTDKQDNTLASTQAGGETGKRANRHTQKSRAGRQFIAAHVLPEAAKQFKLLAVQSDKTTQELLVDAINDLFAKHGLSRIAD